MGNLATTSFRSGDTGAAPNPFPTTFLRFFFPPFLDAANAGDIGRDCMLMDAGDNKATSSREASVLCLMVGWELGVLEYALCVLFPVGNERWREPP